MSTSPVRNGHPSFHVASTVAFLMLAAAAPATAGPHATRVVPSQYPSIQAAVDAAAPGDTVRILAGTYSEEIRIRKDLDLVGAGRKATVIRAPSRLHTDDLGETAIVKIAGGAKVSMSSLTVAGPGPGTCAKGALTSGIRVRGKAHLTFRQGAIRDVHDTPLADCFRSGIGILVGEVPGPAARLTIDHSEITEYQSAGIVVLGFGSRTTITNNIVTGPGFEGGVGTDGIELPVGAVGTIASNVVSGNICPPGDASCGPDWFTQFQHAGILAGGAGPGTVVKNNVVYGNQLGLFLGESDQVSNNLAIGNTFFGIALYDGTFTIDGGQVAGGGGGVWLIADETDTHVDLSKVRFLGLSGPKIGKVVCCGFTATATTTP